MQDRPFDSCATLRWLMQASLGVFLVLLLGIHIIVNHWTAPHGLLTYADVVHYYDVPGIAWMEVLFLIVVTIHCMLGLHSILLDLNLRVDVTRIITWFLVLIGTMTIIYGVWLTRVVVSF